MWEHYFPGAAKLSRYTMMIGAGKWATENVYLRTLRRLEQHWPDNYNILSLGTAVETHLLIEQCNHKYFECSIP